MNMRIDNLYEIIRTDVLILEYGKGQLRKKGPNAKYEISQRMRHLARLKARLTGDNFKDKKLSEFIKNVNQVGPAWKTKQSSRRILIHLGSEKEAREQVETQSAKN